MEQANVSAICKNGNKHDPGNYIPITLTCILCKVIKSIIKDAMMDYFLEKHLLSQKQFIFVKVHIVKCHFLHLDHNTQILNSVGKVHMIYMDF